MTHDEFTFRRCELTGNVIADGVTRITDRAVFAPNSGGMRLVDTNIDATDKRARVAIQAARWVRREGGAA